MNVKYISIALLLALGLAGCKQGGSEFTTVGDTQSIDMTDTADRQAQPELVPVLRKAQPAKPATKAQPATTTRQSAAKPQPAPYAKGEKIYVETDGAQGRVWGYVTMNGDRGTGTIHDWDENTWAVNVTRHGNELFAVDQNSRQYVFKLKQK